MKQHFKEIDETDTPKNLGAEIAHIQNSKSSCAYISQVFTRSEYYNGGSVNGGTGRGGGEFELYVS